MRTPKSDDPAIRLAIRSDRRLVHDALASCLADRTGCTVVGHVTHGRDLFDLCRLRRPDIVLFDAGTDVATSAGVLTDLAARHPEIRLVVTYEHLTRAGIALAAHLGIDSLVPHSHGLDALIVTLQRDATALRDRGSDRNTEPGLTDQEREIITLLGAGHTADQVADLLNLSHSTVENSKRRIYQKMRVTNQSHAIARAAALGVVGRAGSAPADRRPVDRRTPHGPPGSAGLTGTRLRVLLLGPDTPTRHHVAIILLRAHVPFVIDLEPAPPTGDLADPPVAVVADPEPAQWPAITALRLPILLIRSRPMSRAAALDALAQGVVGLLDADRLEEDLIPALTLTASGHLTVSSTVADGVVAGIRARSADPGEPPQLTPREREILHSIASGHTVRQTARALGIAQKTVENIQARLFRKLGVRNRAGAAATAHSLGLLDTDTPERWRYIWSKP